MKKRILAFLLAVSIAVSMLVLPASAAGNANTAVQLSITLNAMDSSQQAALNAVVTRGALARMLVSYSTYRESVGSQGTVGTLFTDLPGTSPYAPYVRIAVQNGWMNGYTDGSFRPDNAVCRETRLLLKAAHSLGGVRAIRFAGNGGDVIGVEAKLQQLLLEEQHILAGHAAL